MKRYYFSGSVIVVIALVVIGYMAGVPELQPCVLIIVKNSDPSPITNVKVAMGGVLLDLGTIQPGGDSRGRIAPETDSNLLISYLDARHMEHLENVDIYISSGDKGRINVEVVNGSLKCVGLNIH